MYPGFVLFDVGRKQGKRDILHVSFVSEALSRSSSSEGVIVQ